MKCNVDMGGVLSSALATKVKEFNIDLAVFTIKVTGLGKAWSDLNSNPSDANTKAFGFAVSDASSSLATLAVDILEMAKSTRVGQVLGGALGGYGLISDIIALDDAAQKLYGKIQRGEPVAVDEILKVSILAGKVAAGTLLVAGELGLVLAGAPEVAAIAGASMLILELAGLVVDLMPSGSVSSDQRAQLAQTRNVLGSIARTVAPDAPTVLEETLVTGTRNVALGSERVSNWFYHDPDNIDSNILEFRIWNKSTGQNIFTIVDYTGRGRVFPVGSDLVFHTASGDIRVSPNGTVTKTFNGVTTVVPVSSTAGSSVTIVVDANGVTISEDFTKPVNLTRPTKHTPEENKQILSVAGTVGSIIGSSLGNMLAGDNKVASIVYSSVLGEIGERLAAALVAHNAGETAIGVATTGGLAAFGSEIAVRAGQAAIGSVSSWLTMELGEALGLKGFGAELFTTVGSTVTTQVIGNLLDATLGPSQIWSHFVPESTVNPPGSLSSGGLAITNAVGSFLGAKLGAMVVSPQTQAGVALSSIGSAIGGFLAVSGGLLSVAAGAVASAVSSLFSGVAAQAIFNTVAPGVGVFVGFVLGALIGNLFGKKKPKIPSASAETVLQIPYARYELGTITVVNNGNRDLVTSMATTARDTLNGLIATVAYTKTTAYVSNLNGYGTTQIYGHTASQIYVKINGVQSNFASADQAVEFGTLTAIRNTKIVGGDIFAKRAIVRSSAADLTSLAGDLQIATDYRTYVRDRTLVDGAIIGAYGSLTEAEQLFYFGGSQALVSKVRAQGLASLTPSELIAYNANKAVIDRLAAGGVRFKGAVEAAVGTNQGYASQNANPRFLADVNGDGRQDLVAVGASQVAVALGQADGHFGPLTAATVGFAPSTSWNSNDLYPRTAGDVNGDGRADLIGFASDGTYVALGQANGTFGGMYKATNDYGANNWPSQDGYPRLVGDVNGDGRADIVGAATGTLLVSLGQANGTFGTAFAAPSGFTIANGWTSQNSYPRFLADVNGDGRADYVGFASDGVYVALGQTNGTFAGAYKASTSYGGNSGWVDFETYPRALKDVNGDGRADIVGFAYDGIYVAQGQANGMFGTVQYYQSPFDIQSGWGLQSAWPRLVGDVDGDGKADVVAIDADGAHVQTNQTWMGDGGFYTANKATVDKILAALGNQAIANPWIITLQRVSELGLDKWTTSDFYGGLQGFLGSFDLKGSNLGFENAAIIASGAGAIVGVRGGRTVKDVTDNAAVIWRFYEGALGRVGSADELTAWTVNLDNGATVQSIADSFYAGWEFQHSAGATTVDAMSNSDYVAFLCTRVLHRTGAAADISYWVGQIAAGMTRAAVLKAFVESAENVNRTRASIEAGVVVNNAGLGLFSILPSARTDGRNVTIDSLAAIGYTAAAVGSATSGNNLIDQSAATTGLTIDDQHTEQRYVPANWHIGEEEGHYETVTVDGGDDIFIGGSAGDAIYGRSGWDWLDGQGGDDVMFGGAQNDVLLGGAGNDILYGDTEDDYLAGGDGGDTLHGGAGVDTLIGGIGGDAIYGEDGDDTYLITPDYVFNWFVGGTFDFNSDPTGKDTISAERMEGGVSFDLDLRPADWNTHPDPTIQDSRSRLAEVWNVAHTQWYSSIALVNVENATGSNYADVLYGSVGDNVLKGLDGDDKLYGRDGNDVLEGGAGADYLDGGAGWNTLSYAGSSSGVFVDLSTGEAFGGDADGDTLINLLAVRGSNFADQLKGSQYVETLEGLGGDDWLIASAGGGTLDGGDGKDFADFFEATAGVTLNLGGYTATSVVSGSGSGGLAAGYTFTNIEGVVGSTYADNLSAGAGDQTFVGGAGNDALAGGAGADTYRMNRGDGYDTITEDNTGWNVLTFGSDVKFSDLLGGTAGGASGWLDMGIRGDSAMAHVLSNFGPYPTAGNNKIKSIAIDGGGQLDIGFLNFGVATSDNAETAVGSDQTADLIMAYNGNDVIWGAQSGRVESNGNVIVGGLGDDTIYTSAGDDQFAYDRGDGLDVINDVGGEDTLVFGATVTAEDVIYEVVGNDLYIAAKSTTNGALSASQVADRVKIVGGGVKYVVMDGYSNTLMYESLNTVEYVLAGGTSIDLRKLSIKWTEQISYNYDNYYPIALDLDGDGLSLSTVDSSTVVVKTAGGGISKIGWVGPTDGFLAVDRNGDGAINQLSELSFTQDKPGATSDLEGLRTWDTNGDGMLDAKDANFSKILLFVDANQNGRSTAKELRTLEQAGIVAINLGGTATGYTRDLTTESFVQNTISFVWADGRTGEGYDVALARRVLGSEGLYAGEYQAEWGAKDADGTLGQLTNDPKTAAKAARIKAKKGLLDRLGATYAEVKAAAQFDFSDNDRIDATIANRWKKMDASSRAAWLSGQVDPAQAANLVRLKAVSSGQALLNAKNDGAQASQDLAGRGLAQAGARTGATAGGSESAAGDGPQGLGAGFGQTAGLGVSVTASEPLSVGVAGVGRLAQAQAWWRGDASSGLSGANSLAGLLAAMDQGVGGGVSPTVADDPALLQQQMLLRQSLAAFGESAGGSVAIWNRDTGAQTPALAASAGLKASGNLSLAS